MQRILVLVVVILAIWGIVSSFGERSMERVADVKMEEKVDQKTETKEVIKIGFIGPLTGDGASYSEPILGAIKIALKEANDTGGINGKNIELVVEDGMCDGKSAASAAQKMVNVDKVAAVVGGVCSGEVFGLAPIFENGKIVVISPSATNPKISESGDYIFRNAPNDAARGAVIADYAKSKKFAKVAIVSEKTDYSAGIKTSFLAQAKTLDIKVVVDEEYVTENTDFKTVLTKVKASNPDIIFINPQAGGNLVRIAKQARDMGIKQPFISTEFNGPEVTGAGKSVEGMVMVVAPALSAEGKGKILADKYKETYGKEMSYGYYSGAAYDDFNILVDALRKNSGDITKIKDYLYTIKHEGTVGTYSFDKNGDVTGIKFIIQKIEGGKLINL